MRLCVFAGTLLGLAGTAAADLTEDVRCREIGFSRAAEARDAATFESFIDPDARFIGNSVLHGPDAVVEAWAPFFEDGGPSIQWRPRFVEVLGDGELALSRGPYRVITEDDDGNPVERWGTFNSVWRFNADGQWRVVFDAGSPSDRPPGDEDRELLESDGGCD